MRFHNAPSSLHKSRPASQDQYRLPPLLSLPEAPSGLARRWGRDPLPRPWLERDRPQLRTLPPDFSLTPSRDRQGCVHLPLTRGRVSFIRRVDPPGRIEINGRPSFVGKRLTGRYRTATIFPPRQALVVKYDASGCPSPSRDHWGIPFSLSPGAGPDIKQLSDVVAVGGIKIT